MNFKDFRETYLIPLEDLKKEYLEKKRYFKEKGVNDMAQFYYAAACGISEATAKIFEIWSKTNKENDKTLKHDGEIDRIRKLYIEKQISKNK